MTASPDRDAKIASRSFVEDDPDADDLAWLDDQLTAFTLAATGHAEMWPLAVVARGGGIAWSAGSTVGRGAAVVSW